MNTVPSSNTRSSTRRQGRAVATLVASAASGLLGLAAAPQTGPARTLDLRSRSHALTSSSPFVEPPSVRSTEGCLSTTLQVRFARNTVAGLPVYHRSYNGRLVGPTLRVRPGDALRVRLDNRLPPDPPGGGENEPHGFNTTNLHTHGLHVSPEGNGDNVFLAVGPGRHFDYCVHLPADHPCGTHWYHAHKHGSVALQLSSGMAGALVVEGGLDDVPEVRAARERVFVFQQLLFRRDGAGEVDPVEAYRDVPDPAVVNTETTINGVLAPVLEVRPGAVERWRFVHAGLAETLTLAWEPTDPGGPPLPWHELAVDGLPLGTLRRRAAVELQPGYRSDVLVQAPDRPGTYLLVNRETDAGRAFLGRPQPKKYLARLEVRGRPRPMRLPDPAALAGFALPPVTDAEVGGRRREVTFFARDRDGRFEVNGREFHPDRVDFDPRVGTAEEWVLRSDTGLHPFHIHVNPFEVIRTDPETGERVREWRDTLLVSDADPEPVVVRMRFRTFAGKTVLHCHNLRHEDRGMMAVVTIGGPGGPAAPPTTPGPRPAPAPTWTLADPDGRRVRSDDFRGRGLLLVFVRGIDCPHCVEQLRAIEAQADEFARAGLALVAVCPDGSDDLRRARADGVLGRQPKLLLLSDARSEAYRAYGCYDRGPTHGTFLVDPGGTVRWRATGRSPFTDIGRLLDEAGKLSTGLQP